MSRSKLWIFILICFLAFIGNGITEAADQSSGRVSMVVPRNWNTFIGELREMVLAVSSPTQTEIFTLEDTLPGHGEIPLGLLQPTVKMDLSQNSIQGESSCGILLSVKTPLILFLDCI